MKLLSILVLMLICCCACNIKYIRKKIQTNEVVVTWFFNSDFNNVSPDIVEIEKSGDTKRIYEHPSGILDVNMNGDSILIKTIKPQEDFPTPKLTKKEIFGYEIVIDSSGSHKDATFIPKGIKE